MVHELHYHYISPENILNYLSSVFVIDASRDPTLFFSESGGKKVTPRYTINKPYFGEIKRSDAGEFDILRNTSRSLQRSTSETKFASLSMPEKIGVFYFQSDSCKPKYGHQNYHEIAHVKLTEPQQTNFFSDISKNNLLDLPKQTCLTIDCFFEDGYLSVYQNVTVPLFPRLGRIFGERELAEVELPLQNLCTEKAQPYFPRD